MQHANDNRCANDNRQRVLITGAGGSIGSEIARQLAAVADLALVDNCEFNLYRVGRAVPNAKCILADVRDSWRVACLAVDCAPDLIIHAAALKHVPICEDNPCEAVLTNVLGTRNALAAAIATGARFLLISTDKAVRPTTVLGATKRLAEAITGPYAPIVRFGNVVGSSGSVVPLFAEQIAAGGPVTVTHPDVTRYMMDIGQAVALVLDVAASATDGVHVLDMGKPVRIADLARKMIADRTDIEITYTGLRRGEKLHEELADEALLPSGIAGVGFANPPAWQDVQSIIEAATQGDDARVREMLFLDDTTLDDTIEENSLGSVRDTSSATG